MSAMAEKIQLQKDPMRDSLMSNSDDEYNDYPSMTSDTPSLDLEYDLWQGQFEFSEPKDQNHEKVREVSNAVQMLTEQMGVFAEKQTSIGDRYSRVKQENAVLQERVTMLEEQLREKQLRGEERLADEQRRNKELMSRIEREKELTIENYDMKFKTLESENSTYREEIVRLKASNDKLYTEKNELQHRLSEVETSVKSLVEENGRISEVSKREKEELRIERERSSQVIEDLRAEVERLRALEEAFKKRSPTVEIVSNELESEVKVLREDNHDLQEQIEDLQAQLLTSRLEEGLTLVAANNNSLAAEFEQMTTDEDEPNISEMEKLRNTLRDSQEANKDLRTYIDGILLTVVENYPQLLEVKRK